METQDQFNVKMLTAAVAALSFYFLSDDMDEVRMEIERIFPQMVLHDKKMSFGSSKTDTFKHKVKEIKSKFNKFTSKFDRENLTKYNDIIFYVFMVSLMLTIMIYGQNYWESNNGSMQWVRDNGSVLITAMIFTVFVIHSRNTMEFINSFYIRRTNNLVCNILNGKGVRNQIGHKIGLGVVTSLAVLVCILLFVVGYYYGDRVRKDSEDEEDSGIKSFMLAAMVISFLFISFFWIFVGCNSMLFSGATTCLDNYSLSLEDKFVTLSMILLTLSGFISWSQ